MIRKFFHSASNQEIAQGLTETLDGIFFGSLPFIVIGIFAYAFWLGGAR